MRKQKIIKLDSGEEVTIREITPDVWNNICEELGEELNTMSIEKALKLGGTRLATLAGDTVELDGGISDMGYSSLLTIWLEWRGVSESFLSLLELTKESSQKPAQGVVKGE